ncbi:MAG: SAM-dependent methyltransferase [Janthinobacterium sp.]
MTVQEISSIASLPIMTEAAHQVYPIATLYIVATPIGNVTDISLRALHLLSLADAVACEDTRNTAHLLTRFGLNKPLIAAHQHNEREVAQTLIARLHAGERIALVSDAGTPAVSHPGARIGDTQLAWLKGDLDKQAKDARIVVFTHRPLFDLVPKWDWATRDGDKAMALLMPYSNVTVFYGHIHQEHHHMTGQIAHHAAKSLIFPLPAPGSQEKRTPLPWDPAAPNKGLGLREVEALAGNDYQLTEFPITRS